VADEELLRAEGEREQNPKPAGGWGLVPDPLALLSAFVCAAGQPQKKKKAGAARCAPQRALLAAAPCPSPSPAGRRPARSSRSRKPAAGSDYEGVRHFAQKQQIRNEIITGGTG
jgi:hypothetical protein